MVLEVIESTSNLEFVEFDLFISCIHTFCEVRFIIISQFEFELRADVPIARLIGELPKQILVYFLHLFYFAVFIVSITLII